MKFFHTADWHLGKIIQGVHMTEDQQYILEQFIDAVEKEKPDCVVIAGDLYDRGVPPIEAVQLLDDVLKRIVIDLKTPVIAIAGNHDSPNRLNFGSSMMKEQGLYLVGKWSPDGTPVILCDEFGEVHFHLVPYSDPSMIRSKLDDERIRSHNDAMEKIVEHISERMDPNARHVFVGHAFVTPYGEEAENTSDSERPLSLGGAEYVDARCFEPFHYTALGHLHKAHYVLKEKIRYAGSPLKYSISEEHHRKGYYIVELDKCGECTIEKRELKPRRDMRTVEGTLEEIMTHEPNDDYVFVRLLDETPVLSPMEKIRTVYPNAMHVERKFSVVQQSSETIKTKDRTQMSKIELFESFYTQVKGEEPTEETVEIFKEVLEELLQEEVASTKSTVAVD